MSAKLRISLATLILALGLPTPGAGQAVTAEEKCPSGFGAMSGVLLDNTGRPLADTIVYLMPGCNWKKQLWQRTDGSGHFHFDQLPAETMYFFAHNEKEYYPDFFLAFYGQPGQKVHTEKIVAGTTLDNVVFQLPPRWGRVEISVTNASGYPMRVPMVLDIQRSDLGEAGFMGAQLNGTWSGLLPTVPMDLRITARGFKDWHLGKFTPKSGETVSVKATMTPLPKAEPQPDATP